MKAQRPTQMKNRLKCVSVLAPNCLHFHLTTLCSLVLFPRTCYALMRKLFSYFLLLMVLRQLDLMGFQPVCSDQLLTALHLRNPTSEPIPFLCPCSYGMETILRCANTKVISSFLSKSLQANFFVIKYTEQSTGAPCLQPYCN